MKCLNFLILFCFASFCGTAQIITTNSKPIDEDRYKDIKGSPYLFENWEDATVFPKNGTAIERVKVNYNTYEKELEAKVDNEYVVLDGTTYPKVLLLKDSSYFQFNLHSQFKNQYVSVHYEGTAHLFFSVTTSRVNTRTINNVGKTIKLENFAQVSTYYLKNDEQLQQIKLKKKEILALFPDKSATKYVKTEGLKLNTTEDVVQLLKYIDDKK